MRLRVCVLGVELVLVELDTDTDAGPRPGERGDCTTTPVGFSVPRVPVDVDVEL